MKLEKLPLAERIRRCRNKKHPYPEYVPSVIFSFGRMPMAEYLAELPPRMQQRFFELLGESCREISYQQAALRVSMLPRRSALEVMRILARPLIRRDELEQECEFSLSHPPRRADARENREPDFPLFRLDAGVYFHGLDFIFGGTSYADTLTVVLGDSLKEYEEMPRLTRLVAESGSLSVMEQSQLLYQVLIRPFAQLEKTERSDVKCQHLPS